MPLFNMPSGCMGPSDIDHYAALGIHDGEQCPGCKLATFECECCPTCHASPEQACEKWCGMESEESIPEPSDNELLYWSERSELFAPPILGMDGGVE